MIHSMRLSLMKGAHADISCTAWQEIGVKPGCLPQRAVGLEWDTTALDPYNPGLLCIMPPSVMMVVAVI